MKAQFLEALANAASTDNFLNIFFSITGCPVAVADERYRRLASAGINSDSGLSPWLDEFEHSCSLRRDAIQLFGRNAMSNNDGIRYKPDKTDGATVLAARISVSSHRYLLFCHIPKPVATDDPKQEQELLALLLTLRDVLAISLSESSQSANSVDSFLRGLFSGEMDDEDKARQSARSLNLLDAPFSLTVARYTIPGTESLIAARTKLGRLLSAEIGAVVGSHLVFLNYVRHPLSGNPESLDTVRKYLIDHHMRICICLPTPEYTSCSFLLRQAEQMLALDIYHASGDPILLRDTAIVNLLLDGLDNITVYCLPYMRQLYHSDVKHGSKNTLTLYVYALCYQNMTNTAKALAVSYNTAKKRISEVMPYLHGRFEDWSPGVFLAAKILKRQHPEFAEQCNAAESQLHVFKRRHNEPS